MSRGSNKSKDGRITLSSDTCAALARQLEDQDVTVVIPAPLLRLLLVEASGAAANVPRYEVELEPDELIVIEEMFDEAFGEDAAASSWPGR